MISLDKLVLNFCRQNLLGSCRLWRNLRIIPEATNLVASSPDETTETMKRMFDLSERIHGSGPVQVHSLCWWLRERRRNFIFLTEFVNEVQAVLTPQLFLSWQFCWQSNQSTYLATTGSNNAVHIWDRHGQSQDELRLAGACTGELDRVLIILVSNLSLS